MHTIQMSGPDRHMIHLAPASESGGTANNICGLNRHARDERGEHLYGFSVGGGYSDPDAYACPECLLFAPGHTVVGMFADLFALDPVVAVIEEHRYTGIRGRSWDDPDGMRVTCSCGWEQSYAGHNHTSRALLHPRHVAEQITAAAAPPLTAAAVG